MSDLPPRPRGVRIGAVSVMVAVVLLVGLFVGILLGRRGLDRGMTTEASALTQPVAAPTLTPDGAPPPVVAVDPASLAARQTVLAGQIAALEARASDLVATADAAGAQAARAESLLAALAARRAIVRGQPLGALENRLIERFGATQPRAVAVVRMVGRQPVTLEDLRQGLDAIGPAAAAGVSDGWWAAAKRELGSLVVLRRADAPSPRPAEHLARARRLLNGDQVEAARAEVAQLPGAGDAASWMDAARRYILVRHALDVLENAALTAPVATRTG